MDAVSLEARAKINWTLGITGAENGYHRLDMLLQSISLADTVTLERAEEITLCVSDPACPADSTNLAFRAAQAYLRPGEGCRITLEKRIPAGAGMGGGSADAAAVLYGLRLLYGREVPCSMALGLGADVPFQLCGGLARATGIGEQLEYLPCPELWLLVAQQRNAPASTAQVYRRYDLLGCGCEQPDNDAFLTALSGRRFSRLRASGGNALLPAACSLVPGITRLLEEIKAAGAQYAAMTGSGSAVFGVFRDEKEAKEAEAALPAQVWHTVAHTAKESIRIKEI